MYSTGPTPTMPIVLSAGRGRLGGFLTPFQLPLPPTLPLTLSLSLPPRLHSSLTLLSLLSPSLNIFYPLANSLLATFIPSIAVRRHDSS
jgi:hypothetical protein